MKNIHQDETYEGRNVLSQYDRPGSSRGTSIFFFLSLSTYIKTGFSSPFVYVMRLLYIKVGFLVIVIDDCEGLCRIVGASTD